MARTYQGLWVRSPLSWKGKSNCRRSKSQASMQPSHNPTSHFLLWSRRAESLSCSTWQIEQHSSHFNYQGRCHRRSKNRYWNGTYPSKTSVGWSSMPDEMPMEFNGSRIALWFQRALNFAARSWMRLIALGTLSIQEPTRCIKTWRRVFSGQEWREKLQSTCQNMARVEESRLNIWD
jgi:hypothetical protein